MGQLKLIYRLFVLETWENVTFVPRIGEKVECADYFSKYTKSLYTITDVVYCDNGETIKILLTDLREYGNSL